MDTNRWVAGTARKDGSRSVGHRVPIVARWPGKIAPNTTSEYAFYFTDLLATFADLLGADLPEGYGENSFTLLPALLGQPIDHRPKIIHHSNSTYALRS